MDALKSTKNSFRKGRIFPVLFMLVITLLFIGITTSIYTVTKEQIELNKTIDIEEAVIGAAGLDIPRNIGDIDRLYNQVVIPVKDRTGNIIYYKVMDKEKKEVTSYVVISSGAGLWGTITAAVGIDSSLESFTGLEIIEQVETPGLGGRITEDWFKKQFKGKIAPLSIVAEGEETSRQEFQAITGATYSTNAIRDMLNKLYMELPEKIKAG